MLASIEHVNIYIMYVAKYNSQPTENIHVA